MKETVQKVMQEKQIEIYTFAHRVISVGKLLVRIKDIVKIV
jgi:hypothetical protein